MARGTPQEQLDTVRIQRERSIAVGERLGEPLLVHPRLRSVGQQMWTQAPLHVSLKCSRIGRRRAYKVARGVGGVAVGLELHTRAQATERARRAAVALSLPTARQCSRHFKNGGFISSTRS